MSKTWHRHGQQTPLRGAFLRGEVGGTNAGLLFALYLAYAP